MRIRNLAPLAVLFVGLTALGCADTDVDNADDMEEVADEMGDEMEEMGDEMEEGMEEMADDTTHADTAMADDGAMIEEGDAETMEE